MNAYPETPEKAIEIMEKAVALYEVLCDLNNAYRNLLFEAKEKLASMRNANSNLNQVDVALDPSVLEILVLIEKGEQLEEENCYGQSLDFYFKALQKLDELIEHSMPNEEYHFTHIDLCQRVGDILKKCGDHQEAVEFYELAYSSAMAQFRNNLSERAICVISALCEKLGSILSIAAEAKKYYETAYTTRKVLVTIDPSEENLHQLASTAKKLGTFDSNQVNADLLSEARDIWMALFKETLDERYFLLCLAVEKMLDD